METKLFIVRIYGCFRPYDKFLLAIDEIDVLKQMEKIPHWTNYAIIQNPLLRYEQSIYYILTQIK